MESRAAAGVSGAAGRRRNRRPLERVTLALLIAVVLSLAALGVQAVLDRGGSGSDTPDQRLAQLEQAVRASPGDAVARLNVAMAYEQRGRYADAVREYQAALKIQPDLSGAGVGLARALLAEGHRDEAAAAFQQVVTARSGGEFANIDQDLAEAYFYQARIRLDAGDAGGAATTVRQALVIEPAVADDWYLLAQALQASGDTAGAIDAAGTAVRFAPDMGEAYTLLAAAYDSQGRAAEATYARGMVAYSAGRYADAQSLLEDAVAQAPQLWEALAGLGLALERQGQRQQALSAYQRALAGDPSNVVAQAGAARLGGGN